MLTNEAIKILITEYYVRVRCEISELLDEANKKVFQTQCSDVKEPDKLNEQIIELQNIRLDAIQLQIKVKEYHKKYGQDPVYD